MFGTGSGSSTGLGEHDDTLVTVPSAESLSMSVESITSRAFATLESEANVHMTTVAQSMSLPGVTLSSKMSGSRMSSKSSVSDLIGSSMHTSSEVADVAQTIPASFPCRSSSLPTLKDEAMETSLDDSLAMSGMRV